MPRTLARRGPRAYGEVPRCGRRGGRMEIAMLGFLAFLWFLTCLAVMAYGLSNQAVLTLGLPRWSSLAVAGLGFTMLMAMFAIGLVASATDIPWLENDVARGRGSD